MVRRQKSNTNSNKEVPSVQLLNKSKEEHKTSSLSKNAMYSSHTAVPNNMVFTKKNYILLGVSIGIIMLGFLIMSMDKDTYGFWALSVAPVVLLLGFGMIFYAILYKDKTEQRGEKV
ncbi:MAG: DUF3098 domain-containing protein [Bacteroidia bacterium]|nr:DUF3098 domain-containing protein [Bacteroidia bacterium]MDW8301736.1 DUF3098 domain-containing protein [Bacteroidia bacterium]